MSDEHRRKCHASQAYLDRAYELAAKRIAPILKAQWAQQTGNDADEISEESLSLSATSVARSVYIGILKPLLDQARTQQNFDEASIDRIIDTHFGLDECARCTGLYTYEPDTDPHGLNSTTPDEETIKKVRAAVKETLLEDLFDPPAKLLSGNSTPGQREYVVSRAGRALTFTPTGY